MFRRLSTNGKRVLTERLADQHVARLVKRTAIAAGIRGDLAEGARRGLRRALAARRARDRGRGRRALGAAPARPRHRHHDPALPARARSVPGQPDQGGGSLMRFATLVVLRETQWQQTCFVPSAPWTTGIELHVFCSTGLVVTFVLRASEFGSSATVFAESSSAANKSEKLVSGKSSTKPGPGQSRRGRQ